MCVVEGGWGVLLPNGGAPCTVLLRVQTAFRTLALHSICQNEFVQRFVFLLMQKWRWKYSTRKTRICNVWIHGGLKIYGSMYSLCSWIFARLCYHIIVVCIAAMWVNLENMRLWCSEWVYNMKWTYWTCICLYTHNISFRWAIFWSPASTLRQIIKWPHLPQLHPVCFSCDNERNFVRNLMRRLCLHMFRLRMKPGTTHAFVRVQTYMAHYRVTHRDMQLVLFCFVAYTVLHFALVVATIESPHIAAQVCRIKYPWNQWKLILLYWFSLRVLYYICIYSISICAQSYIATLGLIFARNLFTYPCLI